MGETIKMQGKYNSARNSTVNIELNELPSIHSQEAEVAVLGAMLSDPDQVIDMATESLRPADFFTPANQTLFKAMRQMREDNIPVDPSTLLLWLEDRGQSDLVGGAARLAELSTAVVSVLTAPSHIKAVKDKAKLRNLQQAATKIIFDCQQEQHNAQGVCDRAEAMIIEVNTLTSVGNTRTTKDVLLSISDTMQENWKLKNEGKLPSKISTGIDKLDKYISKGYEPGQFIVIAARPGCGKTAIMLQGARKNVELGYRVGIVSLEMSAEQLKYRDLAATTEINSRQILADELNPHELDKIAMHIEDQCEWPVFYEDVSSLTAGSFRSRARKLVHTHKVNIIYVDYLQLMEDEDEPNRQQALAKISRAMKNAARELRVPIVALAQLNRKTQDGNTEPELHHLRESGAIEQDADIVILMAEADRLFPSEHDEEIEERMKRYEAATLIKLAKQRNEPTVYFTALIEKRYQRFTVPDVQRLK